MKEQPDPKKFADDFDGVIQKIVKPSVQATATSEAPPIAPPETPPMPPVAPIAEATRPDSKPVFFADVDAKRGDNKKDGSGTVQEKKPGILKRGLKYTIDQLNPIKAFKEIRERWRENGAQFNEELFEEKQIEMFFQDIPEAERENYGYSQLLQRAKIIDQARGELFEKKNEKREQFAGIFSALGIKRDAVDDEDVKRLEANSSGQHRILLEIGMKAFANDPQKLENFLNQFHQKDVAFREENLEAYFRAQNGKCGDKIVYGLDRIGRTFKDIGFLRKMAITSIGTTGVVIGGAVVGFGALGVSTLMLGSRIGISALGGLSLGIGKKLKYEGKRREQEDMAKAEHIEMMLQTTAVNLDWGIQEMHESMSTSIFRERRAEQIIWETRKAALWGVTSAVLGRVAGEYLAHEGITFRSLLEKIGIIGGGGGMVKPSVPDHLPGVVKPSVVTTEPEVKMGEMRAPDAPPANYDQFHKPSVIPEPEVKTGGGSSLQNWAETTHAAGADVKVPDQFQNPSIVPETEVKTGGMRTPDAEPQIAKPKLEEIATVKIKAGGNMWASIESKIKADPLAYGLDKTDPNFKTNMNGKISGMLHDFAKKNGLSYKQLDKVFEGDNFKIGHDAAGKPYLYDYQGKAFGGHVSGAVQEVSPSKHGVSAVEDVKPKVSVAAEDATRPRAGAAAEQQPTRARGGGKIKFSPEIEEMDRKAAASGARALESQQYADSLKAQSPLNEKQYALAHIQQVNATGSLLKRVFEGAGVSEYVDVLKKPMSEWKNLFGPEYQISQEVRLNDATDKVNLNLEKLKELYPILRQYQTRGVESIGECLFKAMKDPVNVSKINQWVLTARR